MKNKILITASFLLVAQVAGAAEPVDQRQLLDMPPAAKSTLRQEMVGRLQALHTAMAAIAAGKPAEAAAAVEDGIGMGVMKHHMMRAAEAVPRQYMPEAMKPLSQQSHMLGSQLAETLKGGDRAAIDAKLRDVLDNCVACHKLFRIN